MSDNLTCPTCKRSWNPSLGVPPDNTKITPRQRALLEFVVAYTARHDFAPSYDEIARHLGVSKPTVLEHTKNLIRSGHISTQRYKSRTIVVTNPERFAAKSNEKGVSFHACASKTA